MSKQNFISMELLGKQTFLDIRNLLTPTNFALGLNLEKVKRNANDGRLSRVFATHILVSIRYFIELDSNARFNRRDPQEWIHSQRY
jgi:hypothetical protein